jgi:hypothetical protein
MAVAAMVTPEGAQAIHDLINIMGEIGEAFWRQACAWHAPSMHILFQHTVALHTMGVTRSDSFLQTSRVSLGSNRCLSAVAAVCLRSETLSTSIPPHGHISSID